MDESDAHPVSGGAATTVSNACDSLYDVVVVNMTGNTLATLEAVDIDKVTGLALKGLVMQATGGSSAAFRLVPSWASGTPLKLSDLVSRSLAGSAKCRDGPLVVTCVVDLRCGLLGQKTSAGPGVFWLRSGFLLLERIEEVEDRGESLVATFQCPDESLRDEAMEMVLTSLPRSLASFIAAAFDAAYAGVPEGDGSTIVTSTPPCRRLFYEANSNGDVCVDLSTCRFWARAFISCEMAKQLSPFREYQRVMTSVLWRLLSGWNGCSAAVDAADSPTGGGPVLEVLFLASISDMRQDRQAHRLIEDLVEMGTLMGCVAICVAALPQQGQTFWRSLGFKPIVHFEKTRRDNSFPFGEPSCEFGRFLLKNMVLFSDTFLFARVLDQIPKTET
eukprot:TRINITY_DN15492_c0_g2_i1.p1 TRINITY_DN15492_c0_g2~~TRINITY_DN15492_c0_g2_i1.p1  ORF type:complete len:389 (-),score=46.51 TRINITY_DN15492_c0_g2_i1:71-1237(-)